VPSGSLFAAVKANQVNVVLRAIASRSAFQGLGAASS